MPKNELIRCEGPNDFFVWKHPREDFSDRTRLSVPDSQEALFFLNGRALQLFPPGDGHRLPATGNDCEVYYINKAAVMNIPWGTSPPIQYQDPGLHDIVLAVGANGQLTVQVQDSRRLLQKLVLAMSKFTQAELARYFQGECRMQIRATLSEMMQQEKISIVWIDSYLVTIASAIRIKLEPLFNEYGLSLKGFQIYAVAVPEGDPSYNAILKAKEERARRLIEGITYPEEQRFQLMHKLVSREGVSDTLMDIGIGAGAGSGVGVGVSAVMNEMVRGTMLGTSSYCPKCGKPVKAGQSFCSKCGAEQNWEGDA